MLQIINKLKKQNKFYLRSEGDSMYPVLQSEDIVYFRKIKFAQCQVNDLISVQKNSKLFTHRVIYKATRYLVTKGDTNTNSDGKIFPKQIVGKVYKVKRGKHEFELSDIYLSQSKTYYQEILKLKENFDKEEINYVFLKGLPLHLHFENKIPNRIYADCDLLIRVEYFNKIIKIFQKHKYIQKSSSFSRLHKYFKDKPTEFTYFKIIENCPVIFDLHLEPVFLMTQLGKLNTLYPQSLIEKLTQQFLDERRSIHINGERFSILSSINLIIYLALHFFHHNYQGIYRLNLLFNVIKHEYPKNKKKQLEFKKRLYETISKYRLESFVFPSFYLLKKYFNSSQTIEIESFVSKIIQEKRVLQIKSYCLKINIFDSYSKITNGINRFKNIYFLSPNNRFLKLFTLLNPQVIYSILWVIFHKIIPNKKIIDLYNNHYD